MPLARQNAALASFPTFVELGSAVLRMRRTHARGGSNSMAAVVDVPVAVMALPLDDVRTVSGDPAPPPRGVVGDVNEADVILNC
jgi:hypothetical protein